MNESVYITFYAPELLAAASLICAVLTLTFGVFVLSRAPSSASHRLFIALCIGVAYYGLLEAFLRTARNASVAQLHLHASGAWPFVAALFLHFTLAFTGLWTKSRRWWLATLTYLPAAVITIGEVGWCFMSGPAQATAWGWTSKRPDSVWTDVGDAWVVAIGIVPIIFGGMHLRRLSSRGQRMQTWYLLVGLTAALVPALFTEVFLPWFDIVVPGMILPGFAASCMIIGIGMLRHGLLSARAATAAPAIVATMSDSLVIISRHNEIEFANDAACRMLGYSHNEIVGEPIEHVFDSDDDMFEVLHGDYGDADTPFLTDHETWVRTSEGDSVPVSVSGTSLRSMRSRGAVLVWRDLTERKLVEAARIRLLAEFHAIVDKIDVGIVVIDGQSRVVFRNARAREMLGEDIDVESFLSRKSSVPTLDVRQPGGNRGVGEVTLLHTEWAGESALLVVVRDVTDRRRVEDQLLQAQRLDAMGKVAGGVAHDFNNLLTVILGTSDVLLTELPEDSAMREELAEIRAAGERAASLAQQLLMFSRKHVARAGLLDLNSTVRGLSKMLSRVLGEQIILDVTTQEDLVPIAADPMQMDQVVMNLALNAADAMPSGGRIRIRTSNLRIEESSSTHFPEATPGLYVQFRIEDSGSGIAAEHLPKVFEPFFTTKPVGKGTGLGLAVVYGIIREMGGHIHIESTLGTGTAIAFLVPAADASLTKPATTSQSELVPSTRGGSILLVEDERIVLNAARRVLSRNGYRVHAVTTVAAAHDAITATPEGFDLVLSDVVLSDGNGVDLAEWLREHRPRQRVLLTSGHTEEKAKLQAIVSQAHMFLPKPYTAQTLLHAIRVAMQRDEPEPSLS